MDLQIDLTAATQPKNNGAYSSSAERRLVRPVEIGSASLGANEDRDV
jgi:hypothetical protein